MLDVRPWPAPCHKSTAALAFLLSLTPIVGWAQKTDVSNHAITCNTLVGRVSIKPPLVVGGTTPTTMTVKALLAGCTVIGAGSVTILSGKMGGTVSATSNECVTLSQTLTGTLKIKWKADHASPIVQKSSTLDIEDVTFSAFGAPWGAAYGQFSLGVSRVTGAFTGGDAGATSSNVSLTSQDILGILAQCSSPPGLKTLSVGLGTITLQ